MMELRKDIHEISMRVEDSFGTKHFSKSAAPQGDDNSG